MTTSSVPLFKRSAALCSPLLIALRAVDRCADAFRAFFLHEDPSAVLPGRTVPHVLRVSAAELGDPVLVRVLVEASNRRLHALASREAVRRASQLSTVAVMRTSGHLSRNSLHSAKRSGSSLVAAPSLSMSDLPLPHVTIASACLV
jgi:hypothetical protein